ncbi:MAG: S8 family serine peptidase, partial [Bacteroidales bacterium]|nr:S8 family serine peptidase [Bacteroidales bacterium]
EFNIPGSGPHEIALNYYLPQIKSSTTIDATTQVGYTEGNPAITLSGQNKFASGFDVNNATTLINGIHIKNFNNNGVLLYNASNSRVENCVFTSITNTIDTKTAAVGIRIVGSNNVELYGNDIQVKLNSTSSLSPTYGVFVDKSFYCIIGGTEEGKSNLIANCGYVGVAVRGCNYNKISGNIFDNNEKAIEMVYSANAGIQPPEITDYQNGILSGTALPNSTIEVFGSTGEENANEYLESTIADGGGGWSVEVSTGYEYFVGTQRDGENNSSGLSSVFINTITTQLLTMYQNTDSIDLDDFLYASILPDAIQYEFNVIQTDSGVNQIITKDVNYFSLLELENNEAYYDKEYKIKVRAVFENEVSAWGDEIVLRTIDKQKYRYGIAHIRILPSYNNAIIPFSGIDNSVPILIEGYDELNSILKVNTIEKTFPKILNKLPDLFNIYTIYFDESFSTDSLISWANQTAYFEYVSKYPIYKINEDVNDPYFENPPTQCTFCDNNLGQWSLQQLNAENTWNLVENDNIIKIAIVDNAVRYDHQDLHDNIYINTGEIPVNVLSILLSDTYDTNENNFVDANEFVNYCNEISPLSISNLYDVMNNQSEFSDIFDGIDNDDNGYVDDIIGWDASDEYNNDNDPYPGVITTQGEKIFAHGTHVAGIASAVTNNNEGMASLSFNHSRIIPVKTTKDTNSSNFLDNSYDGVQYAIAAGADIINMSWGAEWTDAIANYPLYSVITSAHYNLGITFIASMGNDWGYKKNAPACIPVVVAIGATNSSQSVANFSTHGNYMDFFAPGADILSTYSAGINEYFCESGTSMSCPLASSLWALIKSINPNATFNQIYNCITSTCYKPSFWSTDCTETVDPTPWSTQISKYGIINPYDAVLCFNELPPVAMFEHLGGSTCPETDLYFYSISSGGPISSEMTLSWTCSNPEVLFSTPSALNTNISFPDEGTYTIVFTIFDVNHEIISQYEENIFAAYPKVEFNNVYNFSSCYGFEVSVFLEFSGNPPFSFNYRLNDGPEITINNVVSQNYSLIVDGSNILSVGSSNIVSITNVSDYSCLNSDDVFITTFEIIDCDLCSRNHNNVMTWNQGQMQFAPSSFSYTPSTNTFPESSCAISDNFGNPLLLMKGDYLYNLTCINALNEYTEITGSEFGFSSKEGSIILPHDSGNPYLYYALVVTDNNSSSTFPMSLKYYLIDVSEMQIINTEIILKDDVEVMEACKISDDYGYWILTNTKSINKNNLYKLQNNILEFQGEIEVPYRNISAHMCFSPNMNLLAAKQEIRGTTEFTYATNIYNFNRDINCPIEDRLSLVKSIEHVTFTPYNYEFSPNSQLLYITGNESGLKLMQFPIYNSDNNPTYIKEGEQGTLSGMRLGLDGKLYIELIVSGGVDKISYLRAPNEIGEACMYVNGAYISNTLLGIELSRRIPEIPFNFSIKEEVIDCQNNLIIEDLTGYEPFTYLWSNSSTDDHINNIVPGEYSVTISDMYNCTLSKNINVQEFNTVTCFINAVNDICFGTINSGSVDFTITDGAAPYIVELIADVSVSETLNVDNYGSYTFENLGVNDYSIQVIDDNGCIFETNFSIGLASEMILTISVLNIPCEGSANGSAYADVQFGVSPYSYIWSNGETNQTAVLLTGGEFEVTVIDNNNCSVTGDIFISENESPSITLTAVPGVICAGESSTITAGATGGLSPCISEWSPILPQQENNIV